MKARHLAWLVAAVAGIQAPPVVAQPEPSSRAAPPGCAVIPMAGAASGSAWRPLMPHDRAVIGAAARQPVRYEIDAVLDPLRHTVTGTQRMTWRNPSALPVCAVYLHLDFNAFEGGSTGFMSAQRTPLADGEWGYTRLARVEQLGRSAVWMYTHPGQGGVRDRTLIRVDLPQPVAPGASTTLTLGFMDRLPRARGGIGHHGGVLHVAALWFPQVAVLELPGEHGMAGTRWNVAPLLAHRAPQRDRSEFDVRLSVPRDYTAVATGETVLTRVAPDGSRVYRFMQSGASDFAWAAGPRYRAPLEYTYTPSDGDPVKLRVLHRAGDEAMAAAARDAMADAVRYHSHRLHTYPHRTLTAVIVPQDATTSDTETHLLTGNLFWLKGTQSQRLRPEEHGRIARAAFRAVAQTYFPGGSGSAQPDDAMLADGIVEFWVARAMRDHNLSVRVGEGWWQRLGLSFAVDGFSLLRLRANRFGPNNHPGADNNDRAARIALALHDLEARIGAAAIDRGFREHLRRWPTGQAGWSDFRDALAQGSGRRKEVQDALAWSVHGPGRVDDRIAAFTSEEVLPQPGVVVHDGRHIELSHADIARAIGDRRKAWRLQHRNGNAAAGPFPYRTVVVVHRDGAAVPQRLQVTFADGSTRRVRWAGAQSVQRFTWITPARAVAAQLDPDRVILLDAHKSDDGRMLAANTSVARRWGGNVAATMQVASALLVNL